MIRTCAIVKIASWDFIYHSFLVFSKNITYTFGQFLELVLFKGIKLAQCVALNYAGNTTGNNGPRWRMGVLQPYLEKGFCPLEKYTGFRPLEK